MDWPLLPERVGTNTWVISPMHVLSLGNALKTLIGDGSLSTSTAWPAANRAIHVPFRLPRPMTAYQMVMGAGATAAGNFDMGIYDEFGNREVSLGSTAKAASAEQVGNITDKPLGPGLYYMALSADGTNNYIGGAVANAAFLKMLGVRQSATSFPLPDPVTFATVAATFIPAFAVILRSI